MFLEYTWQDLQHMLLVKGCGFSEVADAFTKTAFYELKLRK